MNETTLVEDTAEKLSFSGKGFHLKNLLPYLSVSLLFIIMIRKIEHMDSIVIGCAISILLVVIRQMITLWQNDLLVHELRLMTEQLETKVKQRTEELSYTLNNMEYMAYHDVLTGLPNRRLFQERLAQSLQLAKQKNGLIAVIYFDLDRFKYVNDSLGHAFGDELLQEVAKRLTSLIRKNDTISRQGGDEFTILLNDMSDHQEAMEIAKRIQIAIARPFVIQNSEVHITTSIGISIYPNHGNSVEILMKNADAAMYRSKESGKNCIHFYSMEMNEVITRKQKSLIILLPWR